MAFWRRFDGCSFKEWENMIQWCRDTFNEDLTVEPTWCAHYPTFYFIDEGQYILFLLMWGR